MLKVRYSNQFKKDYKLIQKRGYNVNKLKEVVKLLSEGCIFHLTNTFLGRI